VSLAGVLRSELAARLEMHLAHYLRDPTVQVRPLIRILIEGEVAKPGYYAVPPEMPLADALTSAGGLTQRAKPTRMRVERGSAAIWSGDQLQQALGRGFTLDQLSLRAGDRLFVPARGDVGRTIGIIGGIIAIPVLIYTATRLRR
jgi:protein involved in polysaccharide export with SLBB domain